MVFVLRFLSSNLASEPSSNSGGTMGAASSCGKDNDDLIDIFKVRNYITSKKVERVFRAVDRGDYIFESHRELAYQDMSCKVGNIHLSAPCIYCCVMEGLSLQPGQSFLNIGSGTGYLSTMAGLILGDNGTNHGIEMHEDCLIYAQERLERFKRQSLDVDLFEFCEPVFQLGNFINVEPNRRYDRVYCGAECPEAYESFVKQFVKVGGILVMPYKDNLLTTERTGEKTWFNHMMLPVSFAPLMPPQEESERFHPIQLPLWKPRSLQELCRSAIRSHLRRMVWAETNDLENKRLIEYRPIQCSRVEDSFSQFYDPIEDANTTRRRQFLRTTTTLQLMMNSTMQSILTEGRVGLCRNDWQSHSNDDSEEDSEPGPRNRPENPGSMDEGTEDCEDTKESRAANGADEATGEDEKEERARHGGQSSSSSMESAVSNESSTDEERGTVESMSDDDEEENDRNFALVRNFFSRIASIMEIQDSSGSSESSSSDWSSSDDNEDNTSRRTSGALPKKTSGKTQRDKSATSNVDEAKQTQSSPRSSNSRGERCRSKEIGAKIRVLSTPEDKTTTDKSARKTAKTEDKKDRKVDTDSSNTSSEDGDKEEETTNERTNYRRDYRPGQKRRSERKFSGGNKDSTRVKKTHKSDANSPNEKSASNFVTMSTDRSFDTVRSDSDCDVQSPSRKAKVAQIYAHTIRKNVFSACMKKKILLLPLPLPLRVYVNYDREL